MRMMKRVGLKVLVLCLAAATSCTTLTQNRIGAPVPFVTTPPRVVSEMLRLADVSPGDIVYDLGSGDGDRNGVSQPRDYKNSDRAANV